MSASFRIDRIPPVTYVIESSGELDIYTSPELKGHINEIVDADDAHIIVIDLMATTFIDSSALGVLIGALRRVRQREGQLKIAIPADPVRKVFEITRLDNVFDLHPTLSAALASSSAD